MPVVCAKDMTLTAERTEILHGVGSSLAALDVVDMRCLYCNRLKAPNAAVAVAFQHLQSGLFPYFPWLS